MCLRQIASKYGIFGQPECSVLSIRQAIELSFQAPCQVLCAFDGSFGAGLVDALAQVALDRQPTLLIAYDSEYPEPLYAKRPVPDCAGVALRLEPQRSPQALARITAWTTDAPAPPWGHAALEPLRAAIPALRALPLLEALAQGRHGEVCLDYLPGLQLVVRLDAG